MMLGSGFEIADGAPRFLRHAETAALAPHQEFPKGQNRSNFLMLKMRFSKKRTKEIMKNTNLIKGNKRLKDELLVFNKYFSGFRQVKMTVRLGVTDLLLNNKLQKNHKESLQNEFQFSVLKKHRSV